MTLNTQGCRFMEKVHKVMQKKSNLSQDAQLLWLMNSESDKIINLFSRYIYDCFKLREKCNA